MSLYWPRVYDVGVVSADDVNHNFAGVPAAAGESLGIVGALSAAGGGGRGIQLTEIPDDAAISNDKLATPRALTTLFATSDLAVPQQPTPDLIVDCEIMACGGSVVVLNGRSTTESVSVLIERLRTTPTGTTTEARASVITVSATYQDLAIVGGALDFRAGDTLRFRLIGSALGSTFVGYTVFARMRHV